MTTMSFSFQEPDWPPVCECQYDEVRDEIDRGNCEIHCDTAEEIAVQPETQITPKKPAAIAESKEESAACSVICRGRSGANRRWSRLTSHNRFRPGRGKVIASDEATNRITHRRTAPGV